MAEFLQEVAQLWSNALRQEMYNGGSDVDSLSQGSHQEELVNPEHVWLDEDDRPEFILRNRRVWQETLEEDTDQHFPQVQ